MRRSVMLSVLVLFWFCCFLTVSRPAWSVSSDSGAVPVVAELLLGGWLNGNWVDADTIASYVPAGKRYQAYSFDGPMSDLTGEAPKQESEGCEYWSVSFGDKIADDPDNSDDQDDSDDSDNSETPENSDDSDDADFLAVGSTKPGMPRSPRLQTGGMKPYEDIVAGYLKKNGISADPEIQQLVRVDLDGDGSEEVILVASNADATVPVIVKDTYTLVLFRHLRAGRVITSVMHELYYHEDIEGMADSSNAFNVAFVVDINGDGVLELILKGRYYEGFWYEIHEFKNGELKKVLSDGLGA